MATIRSVSVSREDEIYLSEKNLKPTMVFRKAMRIIREGGDSNDKFENYELRKKLRKVAILYHRAILFINENSLEKEFEKELRKHAGEIK